MRGRLPIILMALVALALVLSLAATLAPVAGAQDSGAAPSDTARWMRYVMPTAQQLEAAAAALNGFIPIKDCAIKTMHECQPIPTTGTSVSGASAAATSTSMPMENPRWWCP